MLANPSGLTLDSLPFEEVLSRSLGFLEDNRFHKAFCAALIIQASNKEIKLDRIFALTGNNPYLIHKIVEETELCLDIIITLNRTKLLVKPRAARQIQNIRTLSTGLVSDKFSIKKFSSDTTEDFATFVKECIHAKK